MGERGKAESVMKVGDRVEVEADPGEWSPGTVVKVYEATANGKPTPYVVVKYDEGALYEYSSQYCSLAASLVRPLSQGYAVGDEVEIFWNDAWHPARVIASFGPTIGVPVEYSGDRYVWHPDDVRRPQRTDAVLASLEAERELLRKRIAEGFEQLAKPLVVPQPEPPASPSRCPRCHGPRDAEARAHLHLCGCLVKWDVEAIAEPVTYQYWLPESAPAHVRERLWCAEGCDREGNFVRVDHPLRDTAIALWRERVQKR